jgi:hypothetical protein
VSDARAIVIEGCGRGKQRVGARVVESPPRAVRN